MKATKPRANASGCSRNGVCPASKVSSCACRRRSIAGRQLRSGMTRSCLAHATQIGMSRLAARSRMSAPGCAETGPRFAQHGSENARVCDDPAPLRGGFRPRQHETVVGGERARVPPRAARARGEEAFEQRAERADRAVHLDEPARVAQHQAAHRCLRGQQDGRGAADGVADDDGSIDAELRQRTGDQLRVARRARRSMICAGVAMRRPLDADQFAAVACALRKRREIVRIVAHRGETDDGRAAPGSFDGQRHSVYDDSGFGVQDHLPRYDVIYLSRGK